MANIETLGTLGGLGAPADSAGGTLKRAPQGAPEIDGELGASGTPIFSGFLRELGEYNPQFAGGPFACFQLYEQMRRSDAQVRATLQACKLPIRGAEWTVVAPEDASPVEQEATDFVEHNLFERVNFEAAIENALLMLDFGCAAHEDVWEIDGGQVCLKRLAPRLPLTFYRWITKPGTDDLAWLDQMGYRAGSYVNVSIPAGKLALFTFQQEGANYAGQSLLRAVYQHWYTKQALYAVDAIGCERNGMGVPVITMGEGAKKEDRVAATDWVQKLIVHEKTGLVLPPGWTFKLEGVTGTLRDPKDSIQHHNMMIAMAALNQFMVMGQGQHSSGNRSLGETMSDFFFMGLQATANLIAQVFNETTVRRLVDFNFPGVVNYPRLVPQRIMALKFEAIVDALSKLGTAGMMTPDPDLEAWLREQVGAPEKPEDWAAAAPGTEAVPAKDLKPGAAAAAAAEKEEEKEVRASAAAQDVPGNLRRAPRGAECHLALTEIVSGLDKGRDDVAAALRAARSRIQAEVVNKLVNTPVRRMHQVSIAPDAKLIAEVEAILGGVKDFGQQQVAGERARQGMTDAATVRMAAKREALGVYADGVVSEFQNGLTARAANVALDHMRRPLDATKGEVIRSIESDLDDQSDKWVDAVASKGANESFADGRDAGYEQYKDEIGSVIYSALLDINTCEQCAGADGAEAATPDGIPDVPNPDCDGGDKCRCVHVYVFSDEGKAA